VRSGAPFSRTDLARELDRHQIGNRMLFGGNLLRQPAFVELRQDRTASLRVVGEMKGSDEIMNSALFLGTYPGLCKEQLHHEASTITTFIRSLPSRP
jgi:CDP-6-deoxy-D-xylo-4-hexulose-3-dehydrase